MNELKNIYVAAYRMLCSPQGEYGLKYSISVAEMYYEREIYRG